MAIIYFIKYSKRRKSDAITVLIGSLDFITGLISVLVVVAATQIIALIASGATLFKVTKIFIQSEKVKKMIDSIRPIVTTTLKKFIPKVADKVAKLLPIVFIKNSQKGENTMKKFLQKLGNEFKANPITTLTEALLTVVAGLGGYGIYNFIAGFGTIPYPWSIVLATGVTLILYAGFFILVYFLGHDNPATVATTKAIKGIFKMVGIDDATTLIDGIFKSAQDKVDSVKAEAEKQRIATELRAKAEAIICEREKKAKEEELAKIAESQKKAEEAEIEAMIAQIMAEKKEA